MSPLTSKERVLIALRHEEPDRVPVDFGARHSIHISAHRALKRHLGLNDGADTIRRYLNHSAEPDPRLLALLARFATDVVAFPVGSGSRYTFRLDPETNSYTDEWGITMRMPPGGYYYDPVGYPLATALTVAEVERFPFPDPADPHRQRGPRQGHPPERPDGRHLVAGLLSARPRAGHGGPRPAAGADRSASGGPRMRHRHPPTTGRPPRYGMKDPAPLGGPGAWGRLHLRLHPQHPGQRAPPEHCGHVRHGAKRGPLRRRPARRLICFILHYGSGSDYQAPGAAGA